MPQHIHHTNPFPSVPLPIPITGTNLLAANIFEEQSLAQHLDLNAAWLQYRSRESEEIHAALFPEYCYGGVAPEEIRHCLNRAMWDAGYTPDVAIFNPRWYWLEGEELLDGQLDHTGCMIAQDGVCPVCDDASIRHSARS